MSMIIWLTLIFLAVLGVLVGIALRRNGVIGHGIGNNFGKHYMHDMGEGGKDATPDRWDS